MTGERITSQAFFQAWVASVNERKEQLVKVWRNKTAFTSCIKGDDDCLIDDVAKKLNLLCYPRDYYSIDTILYKKEDLVHNLAEGQFWFKDIRVAFEHENNFNFKLFQEVSHLLLINADLKVLVSYPNGDTDSELNYLHEIVKSNRLSPAISDLQNFLVILGYENGFTWEGLVFNEFEWKEIPLEKPVYR